jgi:hypothetical protein
MPRNRLSAKSEAREGAQGRLRRRTREYASDICGHTLVPVWRWPLRAFYFVHRQLGVERAIDLEGMDRRRLL